MSTIKGAESPFVSSIAIYADAGMIHPLCGVIGGMGLGPSSVGGNVIVSTKNFINRRTIAAGTGTLSNGSVEINGQKVTNHGNIGQTSGLGKHSLQQHNLNSVTLRADTILIAPESGTMIVADTLRVYGRLIDVAITQGVGIGLFSGVDFNTTADGTLDFTRTTAFQPISGGFSKRIFSNRVIPSEQWKLQGIFFGPVAVFPADTTIRGARAFLPDGSGFSGTNHSLPLRLWNVSLAAKRIHYSVASKFGWAAAFSDSTEKLAPFGVDSLDVPFTIPPNTARGTTDTVSVTLTIDGSFVGATTAGQQQQFTAVGMNADEDTLNFPAVWTATGGVIDSTGLFTATQEGSFVVTCNDQSSGVSGTATVHAGPSSVQGERTVVPASFDLRHNHPNPFNPETTIEYHVKDRCRVVLDVIDLRGTTVARLTDALHEPGVYRLRFQAHGLPSGVYFYQIRMRDFQAVQKMLLVT
ncbi:MAG: hypothetical protein QHJ34_14730 [bacterium]|nr:hypothetical protein [candidate division KSB1 bacterium]MDH7561456.1 hypothetical protein [bacterium]